MGWSHGKRWTDDELEEALLSVASAIQRVPTTADLKSHNRKDLIQAVRRRGGLRSWQARLSEGLSRMQPCGDETDSRQAKESALVSELESCPSPISEQVINPDVDLSSDEVESRDSYSLTNDDTNYGYDDTSLTNDDTNLTDSKAEEPLGKEADSYTLTNDDTNLTNDDTNYGYDDTSLTKESSDLTVPIDEANSSNFNQFETEITSMPVKEKSEIPLSYQGLLKKTGLQVQTKSTYTNTVTTDDSKCLSKQERKRNECLRDFVSPTLTKKKREVPAPTPTQPAEGTQIPLLAEVGTSISKGWTPEKIKLSAIRLFLVWSVSTSKARSRVTQKKINIVGARLRQGYSEKDLEQCLRGFAASPWHCGVNPRSKEYNDFLWCLQNGDKVEQGIGYFVDLVQRPSQKNKEELEDEHNQQAQFETKARHRAKVLARRNKSLPKPKVECTEIDLDEIEELVFSEEDGE